MLRGNDGKILIVVIAVVLVVACSVVGVAVISKKPHGKKSKVPDGPVSRIAMGELIVNLADTNEIRYLKTDIVLEIQGQIPAAEGGEGGEGGDSGIKTPLRDAIIGILSSKKFSDLNQPGGKDEIKKEITTAADKQLENAKVTAVYFNEFAMQ